VTARIASGPLALAFVAVQQRSDFIAARLAAVAKSELSLPRRSASREGGIDCLFPAFSS